MATNRYVFSLTSNAGGGPSNPAIVDFDLDDTSTGFTYQEAQAQLIAYLVSAGQLTGVAQRITGCVYIPGLVTPGVPIAFPTTEFGILAAANTDLAGVTGYGVDFGGGSPCPRGTSVCVSEHTSAPGRFGKGKHYLPFTKTVVVDGVGTFSSSVSAQLQQYYDRYVLSGYATWAAVPLKPCVQSKNGGGAGTVYDILTVQPSSLFSMLQSRKR